MLHGVIPALALMLAGIVGALGADSRLAWAGVFIAGLFLVLPV